MSYNLCRFEMHTCQKQKKIFIATRNKSYGTLSLIYILLYWEALTRHHFAENMYSEKIYIYEIIKLISNL